MSASNRSQWQRYYLWVAVAFPLLAVIIWQMLAGLEKPKIQDGALDIKLAPKAADTIAIMILTNRRGQSKSLPVKAGKVPWPVGTWDIALEPKQGYEASEEKWSVTVTAGSELPLEIPALQKENVVMASDGKLKVQLAQNATDSIEKIVLTDNKGESKQLPIESGELDWPEGTWAVKLTPKNDYNPVKVPENVKVDPGTTAQLTIPALVKGTTGNPIESPTDTATLTISSNLKGHNVWIRIEDGEWEDKGVIVDRQDLKITGLPKGKKVYVEIRDEEGNVRKENAVDLEKTRKLAMNGSPVRPYNP